MSINDERLIQFCRDIIRIPSLAMKERAVAHRIRDELLELSFDSVKIDEMGSVLGIIGDGSGPVVIFDAHIDTVSPEPITDWSFDPFGAWLENDRIYGRGAMDMKGSVAAVAHGLASLVSLKDSLPGTIIASLSTMEEVAEGIALAEIIDNHGCDFLVICEASDLKLVRAQRGRAEMAVTTHGVATHSSTPYLGVDAVCNMMQVIKALKDMPMPHHDFLGDGVQALTGIISNPYPAMSTVPWECYANFDRRLLIGETESSVLEEMHELINKLAAEDDNFKAEVSIEETKYSAYTGKEFTFKKFLPAWETSAKAPIYMAAQNALKSRNICTAKESSYQFCTNGSLPERHQGIPTIGFGPGNELNAHRKDEFIEVKQLISAAHGYAAIAEALVMLQ